MGGVLKFLTIMMINIIAVKRVAICSSEARELFRKPIPALVTVVVY